MARHAGPQRSRRALARVRAGLRRQRVAAGHGSVRRELRRPPVRPLGRTTRRWPRDHARRNARRARQALGTATQGCGPDAVLAQRRWPRGAALVDPRIPVQRSDAPPRRADHARTEPGRHRRVGRARHVVRRQPEGRTRRHRVPRLAVVHPLRQLRTAVHARRPRRSAAPRRLLHRARFPRTARRRHDACTAIGSRPSPNAPRC